MLVVDHCSSIEQAIKKGYLEYEPKPLLGTHKQNNFTVLILSVFDIVIYR